FFSRKRIKRGSSDSVNDPVRTGALPAGLSNMGGQGKDGPCVWNGIFACDKKSSRARCYGAAGVNRRTPAAALECGRSRGLAPDRESRAPGGPRNDVIAGTYLGIAPKDRCDV